MEGATFRSSRSLSTLDEESQDERKPLKPPSASTPRSYSPIQTVFPFLVLFLFLLSLYLKTEIPSYGSFFLGALGVAICSLVAKRSRLLCLGRRLRKSEPVRWIIGNEEKVMRRVGSCNGRIVREGVEFYTNGDVYEGEFHKGRCNGSGVYNFYGKGRYEGDWVDGKYDGYGIESWARGSRYRGQYRQGRRHGLGVYRFYNGDRYAGEWCSGQSHGIGAQSCSDGSCYVGEFKCGVKHGLGFYRFRNGDRYSGQYFGDKIHGFGVYHFANGHSYEGSWHEGQRQGFGTYTFRNAETKSGEWDCGVLKNPLLPSDPSVDRASQAARKAAEDVNSLPKVEEQVNKAVAAANKAAMAARVAAIKAVQNRMDGKFCDTNVQG